MNQVSERVSSDFGRVAELERRGLERLLFQGERPAPDALAGWEYRGMNLGSPARMLGIQKFFKGFFHDQEGALYGYNVRARQNGPTAAWEGVQAGETRRRFGFFLVTAVKPGSRDNTYPQALLLDYGRGDNGRFNIVSSLRDYLVRVAPGSDDLLLGKAFMAFGPLRVPVGYFLLERDHQVA